MMNLLKANVKQVNQKGGLEYSVSGSLLVDLNFSIVTLRREGQVWRDTGEKSSLSDKFLHYFSEEPSYAIKFLYYLRHRKGLGERTAFRYLLHTLVEVYPQAVIQLLSVVPPHDWMRWDDMLGLVGGDEKVSSFVLGLIKSQLQEDIKNKDKENSISLLAKWMPSNNTSSKKTQRLARRLEKELGYTSKEYRKLLAELRSYLNVLESKICRNKWNDVVYEHVPSLANLKYNSTFLRHDTKRRKVFLESVKQGETKIHVDEMPLYAIVRAYENMNPYYRCNSVQEDELLELAWNKQVPIDMAETLVVRDGSGSMWGRSVKGVRPITLANAYTLYFSKYNKGAFKNKFITFSAQPKVLEIDTNQSLLKQLKRLSKEDDCSTTNVESVFNLLLDTAKKHKLKQDELPHQILIISDMQFDYIRGSNKSMKTVFEKLQSRFEKAGYLMPKLIFWNVAGYTGIPIQNNELGLYLLSGFSHLAFNQILHGNVDFEDAIKAELDQFAGFLDRYSW